MLHAERYCESLSYRCVCDKKPSLMARFLYSMICLSDKCALYESAGRRGVARGTAWVAALGTALGAACGAALGVFHGGDCAGIHGGPYRGRGNPGAPLRLASEAVGPLRPASEAVAVLAHGAVLGSTGGSTVHDGGGAVPGKALSGGGLACVLTIAPRAAIAKAVRVRWTG